MTKKRLIEINKFARIFGALNRVNMTSKERRQLKWDRYLGRWRLKTHKERLKVIQRRRRKKKNH